MPAPRLPDPTPSPAGLPSAPRPRPGGRRPGRGRRLAPLLALVLLAGCASVLNPVSGQRELSALSEAEEIELGRKAHAQQLAEHGAVDDPALAAYVDGLGQRLAAASHRAGLRWTFTVLDTPDVNAFALPGGYVYVTRGILATLRDEAELAGVLGHEIGHVTARHGAQRVTRQQTAGLGVLAATVVGAAFGLGEVAQQLSSAAAAGVVASYSREQELQADQLGAEYLVRNQLDPQSMVDVIGMLKRQELHAAEQARARGRGAPAGGGWLASHPSNDQRLATLRQLADTLPAPAAAGPDPRGRARYLAAIEGLVYGDSPAQGLVRETLFAHAGLGIALDAPAGWTLRNSPQALLVLAPGQDAALALRPVPETLRGDHAALARQLFQPLELQARPQSQHGLAATRLSGLRRQQGQVQAFDALLVDGPQGKRYLLQEMGRSAEARARARPGLREAAASFRPLTPADRARARPWRLQSAPLPAGGWGELARRSPLPPAEAEALLRLLNGADPLPGEPASPLSPGLRVKTVVMAD